MSGQLEVAGWQAAEPFVGIAGDCGGDSQIGEAYSARWWRPLKGDDGPLYAVVDRRFYVATDRDPEGNATGDPFIEIQTEYTVCRDPAAPGDTEVHSDIRYSVVDDEDAQHAGGMIDQAAATLAADCMNDYLPVTDHEWEDVYGSTGYVF